MGCFINKYSCSSTTFNYAISPASGVPGSSVTISDTGFNTTIANNIVYFGATQGTVTTASSTSLTVIIPTSATYAAISVLNASTSLTGYSDYSFLPTYNDSGLVPGLANFDSVVNFTNGLSPSIVAISDIDGDGKPDMVVVNSGDASVYLNTASMGIINTGTFGTPITVATGVSGNPYAIAIGDINGDGKLDLILADSYGEGVLVSRNT